MVNGRGGDDTERREAALAGGSTHGSGGENGTDEVIGGSNSVSTMWIEVGGGVVVTHCTDDLGDMAEEANPDLVAWCGSDALHLEIASVGGSFVRGGGGGSVG